MQIDITETNFVRALAAGLLPADEALVRCAQRLVGWLPPAAREGVAIARDELDPSTYRVHQQSEIPPDISDDDLRQALRDWCVRCGALNAPKLLAEFSVTNVAQLPQEKREAFMTACREITVDEIGGLQS